MIRIALLSLSVLLPAPAAAATPRAAETSIPFVRSGGIEHWKVDGDRGLFIQGATGKWYYARTMGHCARLRTANSLGFETGGPDQLDRHGAIRAEGWRCPLESVTRSAPPPKAAKRR